MSEVRSNNSEPAFDVVVVGGGLSGTLAALAAARGGARTALLERYATLGGMATLGLVQPITTWGINGSYVLGGTGRRILDSLADASGGAYATPVSLYGPVCDSEALAFELERRVCEAGVALRYHSWVHAVRQADDGRLQGVVALSKRGNTTVRGRVFVDATGDADLAAFAGVPYETGSQGITLMMLVAGIDRERCPERADLSALYEPHKVGYRKLTIFWHPRPGWAYVNMTEVEGLDGLDPVDLTAATVTCRRQAWEILNVFRRRLPGFEDAYLAQTAPALGVRETRRIVGRHRLTVEDVLAGRDFPDTIARAACPVDIHGSTNSGKGTYGALKRSYGIPYRCLTTSEVPNLLVTGRPISADRTAHSSLRRMAPGMALGEAAGIAAVLALDHADVRAVDVAQLRVRLSEASAVLSPE